MTGYNCAPQKFEWCNRNKAGPSNYMSATCNVVSTFLPSKLNLWYFNIFLIFF